MADDPLYPIALLIDELKSESSTVCTKAPAAPRRAASSPLPPHPSDPMCAPLTSPGHRDRAGGRGRRGEGDFCPLFARRRAPAIACGPRHPSKFLLHRRPGGRLGVAPMGREGKRARTGAGAGG